MADKTLQAILKRGRLSLAKKWNNFGYLFARPWVSGVRLIHLDREIAYPFAAGFSLCMVVGFFLTFAFVYQSQSTKTFLATSFATSSAICSEVPQAVTGYFEADINGYWDTEPEFNKGKSFFELEMIGAKQTTTEYSIAMRAYAESLHSLGLKAENRSLAWSAVALCEFGESNSAQTMRFYTSVSAEFVFDRFLYFAAISSAKNGVCNVGNASTMPSQATIVGTTSRIDESITLNIPVGSTSSNCLRDVSSSMALGQDILGNVNLKFDLRSINLALAINMGLVRANNSQFVRLDSVGTRAYGVFGLIDPYYKHPPIQPIMCLDKLARNMTTDQINGPDICFVAYNNPNLNDNLGVEFFYPALEQFRLHPRQCLETTGATCAQFNMEVCKCPRDANAQFCNNGMFTFGLFSATNKSNDNAWTASDPQASHSLMPVPIASLGIRMQAMLLANPISGDMEMMEFLGSVLSLTGNIQILRRDYADDKTAPSRPIEPFEREFFDENNQKTKTILYNSDNWAHGRSFNELLQEAWAIVCPASEECGAFVFELSSLNSALNPINRYYLQFEDLAWQPGDELSTWVDDTGEWSGYEVQTFCKDILSQATALERLAEIPPVPLTAGYYNCRNTDLVSPANAVGVSAANTNFFAVLVWALLGRALIYLLRCKAAKSGGSVLTEGDMQRVTGALQDLRNECLVEVLRDSLESLNGLDKENQELKAELTKRGSASAATSVGEEEAAAAARRKRRAKQLQRLVLLFDLNSEEALTTAPAVGQEICARIGPAKTLNHAADSGVGIELNSIYDGSSATGDDTDTGKKIEVSAPTADSLRRASSVNPLVSSQTQLQIHVQQQLQQERRLSLFDAVPPPEP